MSFDPFDDSPDDGPVTEEPDFDKKPERKTTTRRKTTTKSKESAMAEVTENKSKLSLTLKGGTGFDAPWVVIYPDSVEEGLEILADRDGLKELLEQVQNTAAFFISKAPAKPAAAAGGGGGNARQAAQEAPGGESRTCQHGSMTFKSGFKNGKTWKGFFCPTPQGTPDQCRPQFVN